MVKTSASMTSLLVPRWKRCPDQPVGDHQTKAAPALLLSSLDPSAQTVFAKRWPLAVLIASSFFSMTILPAKRRKALHCYGSTVSWRLSAAVARRRVVNAELRLSRISSGPPPPLWPGEKASCEPRLPLVEERPCGCEFALSRYYSQGCRLERSQCGPAHAVDGVIVLPSPPSFHSTLAPPRRA